MKLRKAMQAISSILRKHNVGNFLLESTIIAAYTLKKDDLFVLSNPDLEINQTFFYNMLKYARRRVYGEPLAYITHKKEFMGLEFYVNKNVLIPRPDTENLAEEAIYYIRNYSLKNILDLGTGSGAIAISIEHFTHATVIASDISYKALKVANINKKLLKSNIYLVNGNLLSAFKSNFDIIVSNPPYILPSEFNSLSKEVKNEPKIALLCDQNYFLIQNIINQSKNIAKFLLMEIAPNMSFFLEQISELVCIKQDYSGFDRIAIFRF
ncbi:Protein-N(5)-glutamine methyltransferase PrmC [Desulfurella amilsii]|uniref:peptide chain release factor N(5)-glutamine methyltransferase n=1 Tax=Desulfurella amilsii TaxID=1562698 RepID=A0A1X4XUX7_9BACT|nr:HemK/PrmC family methyltransferase [Desulfurella amilsii]OSS41334.1 Protein-N(5)-glutamine methyltransferase PrmC [Desulfurella amilsii]